MDSRNTTSPSKSTLSPLLLALALVAPFGCDDDGDNDVQPREAEVGWTATNHAVARGHQNFAAHVVVATDGELQVACEGGGSMLVAGRVEDGNAFTLDLDFDGCVDDDVVIDGTLTVVANLDVDVDIDDDDDDPDHAGAAVVVEYDGLLVFDGDVEGSCSIDATVRAGAVVFEGFAAAGVSVEGSICGNDADDVIDGDVDDDDGIDDDGIDDDGM